MRPRAKILISILAAWWAMLGFDLFLHAGVLAHLYLEAGPFLLPPREAFRRIPLGEFSSLLMAVLLEYLIRRQGIEGWKKGARFGAAVGALLWGSLVLGLLSISTAPAGLMAGWWLGQSCELALAGAVLGGAQGGIRPRALFLRVALLVLSLVLVTFLLQTLGWAPAMEYVRR